MEKWSIREHGPSNKTLFFILSFSSITCILLGYWSYGMDYSLALGQSTPGPITEKSSPQRILHKVSMGTVNLAKTIMAKATNIMTSKTASLNVTSKNVPVLYDYFESDNEISLQSLSNIINLPNITEEYNETITSVQFSTFEILNEPQVGKYLKVRINAKDGLDRPKTGGGDFWIAVMEYPSERFPASASAPVYDHQNGSYTVDFFVGWTGAVEMKLTLVHPSRAVKVLDLVRNITSPSRAFWNGTYANKYGQTARTLCYMDYGGPDAWRDKCSYPNPKALGDRTAWVCEKPPANFTCDSLIEYSTFSSKIGQTFRAIGKACNCMWLFESENYQQKLTKGPKIVDIKADRSKEFEVIDNITTHLPPCKSCRQSGNGFWRGKYWTSLECKTRPWYKAGSKQIGGCLKNKDIYFLGDSTTRQWVYQLLALLDVKVTSADMVKDANLLFKYNRYFRHLNLNVTYKFYPQILGSTPVAIGNEMYEVDIIDGLQNRDCNYVVVISPWAHFAQWWAEAYMERLRLLKASVERLKARCPEAYVILKSPHVRNHGDIHSQLISSDYIIFKMKQAMEEVFKDAPVFYVNVWDMNNAYPGPKMIHMPAIVINEELSIFLSYLCSDKTNDTKKPTLGGKLSGL